MYWEVITREGACLSEKRRATGDKPWLEGRAVGTTEGDRCGESLVSFEYFVAIRVVRGVYP